MSNSVLVFVLVCLVCLLPLILFFLFFTNMGANLIIAYNNFISQITSQNPQLCNLYTLFNQDKRDSCIRWAAIENKDEKICDMVSSDYPYFHRDECYKDVGIEKNDSSICDKILIWGTYKYKCYSLVAEQKKDPSICEMIKAGLGYESAKDSCLYDVAIARKDSTICGMIKTMTLVSLCQEKASQ